MGGNIFPEAVDAGVQMQESGLIPLLFLLGFDSLTAGLTNNCKSEIPSRSKAAPLLSTMFLSESAAKRFLTEVGASESE